MNMIYVMIVLFFTFPSIIGTLIVGKNKSKDDWLRCMLFFYSMNHGIISVGKIITNKGALSVWDSYSSVNVITIIRYGILLVTATVVIAVLIRLLWEKIAYRVVYEFTSIIIAILAVWILLTGMHISNMDFIIVELIAGMLSIIASVYDFIKGDNFIKSVDKNRIVYVLSILFGYAVTAIIYIPCSLFIGNLAEMEIKFNDVLQIQIISSVLLLLILGVLICYFVYDKYFSILLKGFFLLLLAGYVQTNFLNGKLHVLDGTVQKWTVGAQTVNIIIWLVIMTCGWFLLSRFKKTANRIVMYGSIYISAMQLVSLIVMIFTMVPDTVIESENQGYITTNVMTELHAENNVVVFVLDWFDEVIMENIAKETYGQPEGFEDFTWYQNVTSKYAITDISIPYLLTGVDWKDGLNTYEYRDYAFEKSDFIKQIKEGGYSIGLYTAGYDIGSQVHEYMDNYDVHIKRKCNWSRTEQFMEKCSRYNMAPFSFKENFWYATTDVGMIVESDNVYNIYYDTDFYRDIKRTPLHITKNDYEGAFRFYHLYGAHMPYNMNENCERDDNTTMYSQAKGCLKIVREYLKQLKAAGLYDNATIIITADHGQNTGIGDEEVAREYGVNITSSPVLLVKPGKFLNEGGGGISLAPISHEEFIPTVLEAMGIEHSKYGKTIYEIDEHTNRKRVFTYVRGGVNPYFVYTIDGDVKDYSNWSKEAILQEKSW